MQAAVVLIVLLLAGCSSLTPGQRIGLYCNPVAHAWDLAASMLPGPKLTVFISPCVEAIKDKVQQAEDEKFMDKVQQAEDEKKKMVDCPALDPESHKLLPRCDLIVPAE